MASHDFSSIKSPPKFDELNFPIWKIKMTISQVLGVRVPKTITKEFVEPYGEEIHGPKQPPRIMKQMPKHNKH